MPKQRLDLRDVPTWKEVEQLLSVMIKSHRQGETPLRDLCVIGLLATTGIRTSELLLLKRSDFDFSTNIITITQLKKGEGFVRQTILSQDIRPFVKEYLKELPGERLFDLSRRQILNITHRYTERFIGRRIRSHAFRHAYAIRILEKTRDIELCRRLIGHSRLETVKIYLDFTIGDRMKEVSEAIRIS